MRRRNLFPNSLSIIAIALVVALTGCDRRSLTTDTRSADLSSEKEKVEFLTKYLQLESAVEATEFRIRYKDNSGGLVPGPSDYDIQAVMKVKPDDADRWAEGMQRMEAEALGVESGNAFDGWPGWGYVLLPRDARWQVRSKPAVFASIDGSAMVAIFKAEGIVMKRIVGF